MSHRHTCALAIVLCTSTSLEFCFSVPATAAPFDCSRYGRIQHRIVAHAKMGLLEPDLRSETIVGIIAAPPELDGSLFFNTENQHEELGVGGDHRTRFRWVLTASSLAVHLRTQLELS